MKNSARKKENHFNMVDKSCDAFFLSIIYSISICTLLVSVGKMLSDNYFYCIITLLISIMAAIAIYCKRILPDNSPAVVKPTAEDQTAKIRRFGRRRNSKSVDESANRKKIEFVLSAFRVRRKWQSEDKLFSHTVNKHSSKVSKLCFKAKVLKAIEKEKEKRKQSRAEHDGIEEEKVSQQLVYRLETTV